MSESGEGSFQPIGNLTNKIVGTLTAKVATTPGSTSKLRPASTGTVPTAKPTSISMRTGAHGSGMPSALRTARDQPRAVDRNLLASLPLPVRRSLSETWTLSGTEEFGWDGSFEGFALAEPISNDDRDRSLQLVDAALQPTPAAAIIPELTRVRMTTISRNASEGDMSLMLAAYASSLEKYPRDIVISALRFWSETEKFWPSLSEIVVIIERWIRRRRALRLALAG